MEYLTYNFWLTVAMIVWAFTTATAATGFKGSSKRAVDLMQIATAIGGIVGIIKSVMFSFQTKWWMGIACILCAYIIGGVVAGMLGHKSRTFIGLAGIIGIPLLAILLFIL